MAGRNAIPLSVQEQNRRVHRSNAEKAARAEAEAAIDVPFRDVKPPKYLTDKKLKRKFRELAKMLQGVNEQLCTQLDVDTLARYVMVEADYLYYQKELDRLKSLKVSLRDDFFDDEDNSTKDDIGASIERYERLKNTAFKQVEQLSSKLLLEPAARARAALAKQEEPKENSFAEFAAGGR